MFWKHFAVVSRSLEREAPCPAHLLERASQLHIQERKKDGVSNDESVYCTMEMFTVRTQQRRTSREEQAEKNKQRRTSREEQAEKNKQRRTSREEQAEKNKQRRTSREEQAEKNKQRRTSREEQAEKNMQVQPTSSGMTTC